MSERMTRDEVAKALGILPGSVAKALRRYGVDGAPQSDQGGGRPPKFYDPGDIERVRAAELEKARGKVAKLEGETAAISRGDDLRTLLIPECSYRGCCEEAVGEIGTAGGSAFSFCYRHEFAAKLAAHEKASR